MARLVLIDASPIIGLARVDGLAWLARIFDKVWVPVEVLAEVLREPEASDVPIIRSALAQNHLHVWPTLSPQQITLPDLDEGESACIQIALTHKAPCLLLMDDRAGRSVATEVGVRVAGTAAVIGMAKARGLISSARAVFSQLHTSDFRISAEVIDTVLRRVGE